MAKKRVSGRGPARTGSRAVLPDAPAEAGLWSSPVMRAVAAWVAICLASLAAYGPALRGLYLWDDGGHITRPELQSLHGLWRIWFDFGATQQYYPLLHSAFWLEHHLWGTAVLGYHLVNVALHAASACLIVMIARRLALPGAWPAGMIFALHPVCVEAVAWIAEQKSALSAVFYLAAALAYLIFEETRHRRMYLVAIGLFVLAVCSKTVTATLPAALLVVIWWKRGKLDPRRDVLPLLPWFGLSLAAGLLTAWMERKFIGAEGAEFTLTLAQRCLLAGRVIWFYAGKLLWPANLTFIYPRWTVDPSVWWQYLFPAGVVAAAAGFWLLARRGERAPLAGLLYFTGTLFPVLGFLNVYPFRFSYVADHFQYLASLGIIVPLASVVATASSRVGGEWGKIGIPALLVFLLGVLTWRQSGMYENAETLYRETIARNPSSWMARNNLGLILSQNPGGLAEAIAQYEAALRLKPDYADAHMNLGNALSQMPDHLSAAIAEYRTALRLEPDYAEAHMNLGAALSREPGGLPDAIAEYQIALRLKPDYPEAENNLGGALSQIPGRLPDAIAHYEAALRLRPDYPEAHSNLGAALAQVPGRIQDAIAHYAEALRIAPDDAETHYNLAIALAGIPERRREAIAEFGAALRLRPDFQQARQWIGRLSAAP